MSPAHQACDEPWSAGQNATCDAEFGIEKYPPARLYRRHRNNRK
ncbi:hypothetical protein USDA257_c42380 [Sinorhizobium fredii USDA 257]|uniref:Uncharacterized protein n=1 Tax=Sinorhizobium fredii (strain USDA 257) TaxID=1185652 RepID=I3XA71_SINF2|nr:hypothetical protein USDA257_c42380 [Sinorhizobium fredii USDA 257]